MRVPMTSTLDDEGGEPLRYGEPIKEFMVNNSKVRWKVFFFLTFKTLQDREAYLALEIYSRTK